MSLVRDLNHYNLRAPRERLAEVAAFYANVLGFEARWFEPANGYWLYAGERPLVHLQSRTGDAPPPPTTGVIDHVAFSCAGLAAATARLVAGAVPYAVRPYRELGFTQLVLADPLGVKIELNFNGEFPGPA